MVTIEAYRASIGCFFVTLNNRYIQKRRKSSVRKEFHRNARRTKSTIHKSFLRKTQESQRSSIATFLLPIRLMFLFIITLISIDTAFLKVSCITNRWRSVILRAITSNRKNLKKKGKYAQLIGTLEHEQIKDKFCAKQAKLFGTPEHEKIKKDKMCETCGKKIYVQNEQLYLDLLSMRK